MLCCIGIVAFWQLALSDVIARDEQLTTNDISSGPLMLSPNARGDALIASRLAVRFGHRSQQPLAFVPQMAYQITSDEQGNAIQAG